VAFDDLHFKLKTNGKTRYFSLLQTAPGKSLNKHIRDFGTIAQKADFDDKEFAVALSKIKHIFYRIGYAMSELHQRYADPTDKREGPLKRTLVHGDLHSENVFYDELTDKVTLIDNETFALSIKRPSLGVDDILECYLLHTMKTIAHAATSQLTNNLEFGIDDSLWHELWRALFDGYLSAFGDLSRADFELLFNDFRVEFYNGLSHRHILQYPHNLSDQRQLKRIGPSVRRHRIKYEVLATSFAKLYAKKMRDYDERETTTGVGEKPIN
jgi:hypothetical protein